MLQRALASLLCLLGAASIGLGIASATVWRPSDTLVASAEGPATTTLLLTDPGVLDLAADEVTVHATAGSGDEVVIALGRTLDVQAWVGDDAHTRVTGLQDRESLSATFVPQGAGQDQGQDAGGQGTSPSPAATEEPAPAEGEDAPAEGEEAPAEGEEAPAEGEEAVPDPSGSDLWVTEISGDEEATLRWERQDGRWSVLVAATGDSAGAPAITLTWPQEVATPFLFPAVIAGSALLLAGLVWWVVILLRSRRRSGSAGAMSPATTSPATTSPATTSAGATSPGPHIQSPLPGTGRPTVPAGPTTPTGAVLGEPSADPAVPLTRRQLRERDQQKARADARPGPARSAPDRSDGPGDRPDVAADRQDVPVDRASAEAPPPSRWGRLSERIPGRAGGHQGAKPAPRPDDQPVATVEQADVPVSEPGPGADAIAGQSGHGPTGRSPAAAPSGDQWRRAWGFPDLTPSAGTDAEDGEDR